MNLSIRELNELIYSLGITAHHGMFCQKDLNKSLLDKLYDELNSKLAEEDNDDGNYLTIPTNKEVDTNPKVTRIHIEEDVFTKILRSITEPIKPKGVTQSILDYVEFIGEATYTEMQNYYRSKFGSNSFSHILISLVVPYKNRPTRRYLYKTASGSYVVRVAGLHNWVEKNY
jgi:effector-binding domain-containing protein